MVLVFSGDYSDVSGDHSVVLMFSGDHSVMLVFSGDHRVMLVVITE